MKEAVHRLNEQFKLGLSEDEIRKIAEQAEEYDRLFQSLFIEEANRFMPLPIVDKRRIKNDR